MKIVTEKECRNCKGTGRVYDWEDIVFTFGLDLIIQSSGVGKKKCTKCKGTGKTTITTTILP
jgi:RecJ-like exonuclease